MVVGGVHVQELPGLIVLPRGGKIDIAIKALRFGIGRYLAIMYNKSTMVVYARRESRGGYRWCGQYPLYDGSRMRGCEESRWP
jgi:hypothetical protein